jgi:site-specific DNA recombinase
MAHVLGRIRLSRVTEESTSVARQKEHIERWCKANGHMVVAWAIDEDFSRSIEPLKAPQLSPWFNEEVKRAQWDIVVAWRVDRMGAGWTLNELFNWVKRHDKDLACTDVPFPLSDRNGYLAFTMYADASQREWEAIVTRNQDSQRKAREDGRYHGGRPAYWLDKVKKAGQWTLVLDLKTAAITERLIAAFLARRPLDAIANEFTAEGILSPEDMRRIRTDKEPKGTAWSPASISTILANPILYGVKARVIGRGAIREYEVIRNAKGETVTAAEALITPARFEEIRAEFARRKALRSPRREGGASPMLGVAVCATCQGPLYLQTQVNELASGEEREYRYFRFPCKHSGRLPAHAVENRVHGAFIHVLGTYPRLQPVYVPAEDHTVELEQAQRSYEDLVARHAGAKSDTARKVLSGQLGALEDRMVTLEALPRTAARVEYRETGETYAEAWERMDDRERRQLMLDTEVQALTTRDEITGEPSVLLTFQASFRKRLGLDDVAVQWSAIKSMTIGTETLEFGGPDGITREEFTKFLGSRDTPEPKGTDWSLYGECPTCLVDAGNVCRSLRSRPGESGLDHQGRPAIMNPHKGRPRKARKGA